MATYYTGVPIGGTIWFLGELVGIPIPDNFVENNTFSIGSVDMRKNPLFTATTLPYVDKGYLTGNNSPATAEDKGQLSKTLVKANMPIVTKTKTAASMGKLLFSANQVNGMFTVTMDDEYSNIFSSDPVNSAGTTLTTRQMIGTTATNYNWSYDTVSPLSGTTYRILATNTSTSVTNLSLTSTTGVHGHGNYVAASNETHTHTKSNPSISWSVEDAKNIYFNTGALTGITYDRFKTPSTGAKLITRIY